LCSSLETTTKAADVLQKVSTFFACENVEEYTGCCTDGAPVILWCNLGFQASITWQAPKSKGIHYMLHRQTLVSITLPELLEKFWIR